MAPSEATDVVNTPEKSRLALVEAIQQFNSMRNRTSEFARSHTAAQRHADQIWEVRESIVSAH